MKDPDDGNLRAVPGEPLSWRNQSKLSKGTRQSALSEACSGLEERSPLFIRSRLSLPELPRARQGMVLTMYPAAPSIFYSVEGSGLDKFSLLPLV